MDEYPKVIKVGHLTVTVSSSADEVRWRGGTTTTAAAQTPEPVQAVTFQPVQVDEPEPEPEKKHQKHQKHK